MADAPRGRFEIETPDQGIIRNPQRELARQRLMGQGGPSGGGSPSGAAGSAPAAKGAPPAAARKDRQGARWYNGVLLLFIGALAVMGTQRRVGYAWDEAYYYEPAKKAAEWIHAVAIEHKYIDDWGLLKDSIDAYWAERSEHPSFQKIVSGLSLFFLDGMELGPFKLGTIQAMRLPIALLFGLSLWLIYALGKRAFNGAAGMIAALAYLGMPHIFGHAHFASLETPLVFSTLLLTYCFLRAKDSAFWGVMTGPALGLLLATKINGFFMIPPLLLWGYVYARPRILHSFISMAILGPLCFILLWPWLWPDPVNRTLEYLTFHARHQLTAVWFLGEKFGYDSGHQAPWTYPAITAWLATPNVTLVLAALGLLGCLVWIFKRPAAALFLLVALVNLGVASAPGTPKYDGTRLFLPFFPYLALLAGGGGFVLVSFGRWLDIRKFPATMRSKYFKTVAWLLGLAVVADGGAAIGLSHPFYLTYFNPVALFAGAWKQDDFEVTYWGEAVNEDVLAELNKESVLPLNAKLKVLALHELCFTQLQEFGLLRKDIQIGGEPPYDYHLLLWRRGFFARPEHALADGGDFPPIYEVTRKGSPLLTLHRTGPAFEAYWPTLERGAGPEPEPVAPEATTEGSIGEGQPTEPAPAPQPAAEEAPTTMGLEATMPAPTDVLTSAGLEAVPTAPAGDSPTSPTEPVQ